MAGIVCSLEPSHCPPPKPPASGSMAGETGEGGQHFRASSPPPPAPFGFLSLPMAHTACSQPGSGKDQDVGGGGGVREHDVREREEGRKEAGRQHPREE